MHLAWSQPCNWIPTLGETGRISPAHINTHISSPHSLGQVHILVAHLWVCARSSRGSLCSQMTLICQGKHTGRADVNQEGSRKKVRRRKAVVLVHGVLGSSEHSKQRRGLCGALQRRSCLSWGRMQADTQSSGAHVAQSGGAVFPGSLPGLIFPVVFSVWCVHVPDTHILESPVLTVTGMYVYM